MYLILIVLHFYPVSIERITYSGLTTYFYPNGDGKYYYNLSDCKEDLQEAKMQSLKYLKYYKNKEATSIDVSCILSQS